jgi:hypothetical protein
MSSIPQSKEELEQAIGDSFAKLMVDYRSIPKAVARECAIEGNNKGTTISVCDTVAYLIGWGRLVLKWCARRAKGLSVDFPETGHKWNQLGLLAQSFHDEYQAWDYDELLDELVETTDEILALIASFSNEELYETAWYEKWTLGRMIQLNSVSPMKNIRTKIRRFKKVQITP